MKKYLFVILTILLLVSCKKEEFQPIQNILQYHGRTYYIKDVVRSYYFDFDENRADSRFDVYFENMDDTVLTFTTRDDTLSSSYYWRSTSDGIGYREGFPGKCFVSNDDDTWSFEYYGTEPGAVDNSQITLRMSYSGPIEDAYNPQGEGVWTVGGESHSFNGFFYYGPTSNGDSLYRFSTGDFTIYLKDKIPSGTYDLSLPQDNPRFAKVIYNSRYTSILGKISFSKEVGVFTITFDGYGMDNSSTRYSFSYKGLIYRCCPVYW